MKRDETDLTPDEMLNHTLIVDICLFKASFIESHQSLDDFNNAIANFVDLCQSCFRAMLKLIPLTLSNFKGSELI